MKRLAIIAALLAASLSVMAQGGTPLYDESIDPMEQIDNALARAKQDGRFVICQVGGNWCPWCLKFAKFITEDKDISKVIADNYVYIHVNYDPRKSRTPETKAAAEKMLKRLGNPGRFGYPVLVVLDSGGRIIHIQDSGYLESGSSYDKDKVLRFFKNWTPAVASIR